MIIKFENDIKTDFDGYQKLVDLITKINTNTDQNIIFDFSNVFFFEANLSAVLF